MCYYRWMYPVLHQLVCNKLSDLQSNPFLDLTSIAEGGKKTTQQQRVD